MVGSLRCGRGTRNRAEKLPFLAAARLLRELTQ